MADVIASSMVIRLRHAVHEAGMQSDFCCTTQEWIRDADGAMTPMPEKGPFTPSQLVEKGFSLPAIMDQVTTTALLDRDAALAAAAATRDRMDKLLAAAAEEKAKLVADLKAATEAAAAANSAARSAEEARKMAAAETASAQSRMRKIEAGLQSGESGFKPSA